MNFSLIVLIKMSPLMAVEKLETCDQLKWEEAVEYA